MNRLEEIEHKHRQLAQLLEARGAASLLLRRTRNIAWITAGADASIPVDTEFGVYSVLITPEKRTIVVNTIEHPRLEAEERLQDFGFDYAVSPWHAPEMPEATLVDDGEIEDALQQLRWVLTPGEQERLRALGRDAAAALEETVAGLHPGESEWQIAARLDAACRARRGQAIVNLIATDERIARFRHPLVTDKRLERYAMVVVCMRRHGLIVSATRLAHFGAIPADVREKVQRVAAIDAAVIAASRPGRTLGGVFAELQAAYAAHGETDQWHYHHQGGLAGYQARERIATPGDNTPLQLHQVVAWNPSIVGAKSEDTVLLTEDGPEIVTASSSAWPKLTFTIDGQTIERSNVREL